MLTVAEWIEKRIEALKFRRRDVEERSGISSTTLRSLIRGEDGIDPLVLALGYALGVEPKDFLDFYRGRINAAELDRRIRAADRKPLTPAARATLLVPLLDKARELTDAIATALQGGDLGEATVELPDPTPPQPPRPAPAATAPKRK